MTSIPIELTHQAADYLCNLAPEPRKQLRQALRGLAAGQGDVLELEHPLDGYLRLRSGRYRVIFFYAHKNRRQIIRVVFIHRRALVYELFGDMLNVIATQHPPQP